ncbi:MAG: polysaccharide biosynthesis tyrosine autokinase [Weeksellaceae bacterium]|nr:polysaccharide biosynthesis tyrosine autokinase [Weeksellaceae bacterium]
MNYDDSIFVEETSQQRTAKLKRAIGAYLRRWPYFVLSILFFLFMSWLYLRYQTAIYQSSAKVLVKDTRRATGTDLILSDIAVTNTSSGIDNEIALITSYRIMENVVRKLDLSISYFRKGKILEVEVFKDEAPFLISVENFISDHDRRPFQMIARMHQGRIDITLPDGQVVQAGINKQFRYGDNLIKILPNPARPAIDYANAVDELSVNVNNLFNTTSRLQSNVNVGLENNFATVLGISHTSPNPLKSRKILETVIESYNEDEMYDRTIEFEKTGEFIDHRINIINEELGDVEGSKESFQVSRDIARLDLEVTSAIGTKTSLEGRLLDVDTQLSLLNSYRNYISSKSMSDILPQDISNASGAINESVSRYNSLVIQRNDLLAAGATEMHPDAENLARNIREFRTNLLQNVDKQLQSMQAMRGNLSGELGRVSAFKRQAPRMDRITRDIERQQQIKENLYLLLLQKREEAAISLAITQPKAKLIDPPKSNYTPISPKKFNYYVGAFSLGLLLPLAFIYTRELLKDKIETREDLEEFIKGKPLVAEIPRVDSVHEHHVVGSDLSMISEAFRIMRTNLDFVLSSIKTDGAKVILITSSIKGEGKTFVAMNYAHILGQLKEKKSIIVGADIRNPQLHRFDREKKSIEGLTEYLYHDDVDYRDYVRLSNSDGKTHILFSGRIPPNPTELLMSDKFDRLIAQLRKDYDYVVIDSAPLVLVSDTYHISNEADVTIFVTRSEITPKSVLRIPLEAAEIGRIKNIVFALNDISSSHSGYAYGYKYNYGYGYGYGTKNRKRSLLSRLRTFGR